MGDAEKAIFFYKRYLINAPKAKNRAEVEQKIDALQKQIDERQAPPSGLAPGPAAGSTVEPPSTTTPPPAPAAPAVSSPAAVPSVPAPAATEPPAAPAVSPTTVETAAGSEPARRIDVGLGLGFDTWSSGLRNKADPSFALAVDGGYTFGSPAAGVRFRLGAIFSYTFLKETSWTESFFSYLIDPTIVLRISDRARVSADLGLGGVSITGLQPTSTLLAHCRSRARCSRSTAPACPGASCASVSPANTISCPAFRSSCGRPSRAAPRPGTSTDR